MEKRTLTCIGCPMGCALTVELENGQAVKISGSTCRRGDDYARKEVANPTRIVTSTVRVTGGTGETVSVKTRTDIPKDRVSACVAALRGLTVQAPVHIGDVIFENVADTGVDMVATREVAVQPTCSF